MAKVAIRTLDQSVPAEPPAGSSGVVESRAYFDERQSIHLVLHRLEEGGTLPLSAADTHLSVYVWKGSASAGGEELDVRSSAVVQRGATMTLTAGEEGASILVFSAAGEDSSGEGRVLLLPNSRVPRTVAMGGTDGVGGALHADAHEPTPNVWLHENDYAMADKETALHSHSEDEVIFVRQGSVRIGNRLFEEGTALAIAADTLYEFWSGPDGLSFVNFRATSPTYRTADGSMVLDEAKLWREAVGKPEYLLA